MIETGDINQYTSILWSENHFRLSGYAIGMLKEKEKKSEIAFVGIFSNG